MSRYVLVLSLLGFLLFRTYTVWLRSCDVNGSILSFMNWNFEMSLYCILCREDQRGKQLSSAENAFFWNFDRRLNSRFDGSKTIQNLKLTEKGFQLRWLNINRLDAAFSISITLFSNHLKQWLSNLDMVPEHILCLKLIS